MKDAEELVKIINEMYKSFDQINARLNAVESNSQRRQLSQSSASNEMHGAGDELAQMNFTLQEILRTLQSPVQRTGTAMVDGKAINCSVTETRRPN